jgi:hypothetical protein
MLVRKGIVLVLAIATLGIAVSIAAQGQKGAERKTTSEVASRTDKEKGIVVTTTNRRFTFTQVYPDNIVSEENFRSLLLLEEFQSERVLIGEGQEGSVTVQAWIGKDANPTEKLWTIKNDGDEGAVAGRFYRITKHGCCGAEDSYVFFNIMTGAKVFTSTAPLFPIEVPNTGNALKRYVAYRSDMASIQFEDAEENQNIAGVIEYGSESKMLARVLIRFRGQRQDTGTPKIQMLYQQKLTDSIPLELWGANKKNDKSSLSGFSIVLSYNRNTRIVIPVSVDALDLARARTHPMFALSLEPVPQK